MSDTNPTGVCSNCQATGAQAFCPQCGQAQPQPRDYALRELLVAAFEELTSYDGRIWSTFRALFFKPGQLARDHFDGRRAGVLSPFRTFVLANVVAWLVMPYVNIFGFSLAVAKKLVLFPSVWTWALAQRAALSGVTVEEFSARIVALGSTEDAATVLCMVPLFAVGPAAVLARRGYRYVHHLVFAAHFYCIHLLTVMVVLGSMLMPVAKWLHLQRGSPIAQAVMQSLLDVWVQHLLLTPVLAAYLFFALQRAYALTRGQSAWRAVALALWAAVIARAFFDVSFGVVLVLA